MVTRQTFSTRFYCRKSKADKQGLAPVELSIVINGERTYIRLPRKERPEVLAGLPEDRTGLGEQGKH